MQQCLEHDEVGPGDGLQVDALPVVGEVGRGRAARVDDDEPTGRASSREVPDEGRHRLGDIAAEQQDRAGGVEVGDGEGHPPVHPERPVGGGRRGGHAEAAVVVDVLGAQRDPGELAELVGLLVRQPATAEDGHRVRTVLGRDLTEPPGEEVEHLVPARRVQLAVGAAHQGSGEPVGGAQHLGGGPPLAAHAAPVGREVAGRDLDPLTLRLQTHRALQRAVGAVAVDHQMPSSARRAPRRT